MTTLPLTGFVIFAIGAVLTMLAGMFGVLNVGSAVFKGRTIGGLVGGHVLAMVLIMLAQLVMVVGGLWFAYDVIVWATA